MREEENERRSKEIFSSCSLRNGFAEGRLREVIRTAKVIGFTGGLESRDEIIGATLILKEFEDILRQGMPSKTIVQHLHDRLACP